MCELTGKTTNRRTGYKVLAYKDNKFYSTFTGQQIKVGKVPMPPVRCNRLSNNWNDNLDDMTLKTFCFYHKTFVGKTSAFVDKLDAIVLYNNIKEKILFDNTLEVVLTKITFDNTTHIGSYQEYNIIASDIIKSIKIINP